ncbi:single-stranded DNA-binding protein [Pimelobacter simplex]|uniref:single-stranded DNA-binding protein n=1 Tax=Nocardioides simplex TaxID=2045 RepID=UPI0021500600|nr:single-stranded DNA-binding protein [Pimelobacter simplex]UUW88443.1 single-stranded DNA-binding protein [Pimelobacter simplex]UUW97947.1 single-stranded DNA-binding protein [Pimelobacter simplex]
MLPTITIDGRLTADPELRFTPSGKPVCSMRVAANDSRRLDDGTFENLEQIFVNVSIWERDAEATMELGLTRGDRVLATGRLYEREYDTRDGAKGKSLELKFPTVAKVPTPARTNQPGRPSTPPQQREPAAASGWDTAPATDEPPF